MAAVNTSSRGAGARVRAVPSRVLQWLFGPRLAWYFTIPSIVVVLLVGLAAVLVTVRETATALESDALEETRNDATQDAHMLLSLLTAEQLTAPVSGAQYPEVDRIIQDHLKHPGVQRIKVWSPSGQVLYSDEPSLVGQTFPLEDMLASALQGETVAKSSDLSAAETSYEASRGRALEVYTPIRLQGSPEVVAVLEIASDYGVVAARITHTERNIYIGFAAGIIAIYVILLGTHRWGAAIIGRQRDEVLRQRDRLVEEVGERKRAEADLRESKQMLEDMAQGITDSIFLISKDFEILWANRAALEQCGYDRDTLIGESCYAVSHHRQTPCKPPLDACPIIRCRRRAGPRWRIIPTSTRWDSRSRWKSPPTPSTTRTGR